MSNFDKKLRESPLYIPPPPPYFGDTTEEGPRIRDISVGLDWEGRVFEMTIIHPQPIKEELAMATPITVSKAFWAAAAVLFIIASFAPTLGPFNTVLLGVAAALLAKATE